MSWFRLDDGSSHHSKIMAAGNEAWGAICRAGAASSREGLDGFVKQIVADSIAKPRVWQRGIDAGLLHKVDGGYQIHDFLDWNPSAAEVEQNRAELAEKRRVAGLAGAAKRWDGHTKRTRSANGKPDGKPIAIAIDSEMANVCPSPVPSRPVLNLPSGDPPVVPLPGDAVGGRHRKVNGIKTVKTVLPADWTPNAAHYAQALEEGSRAEAWVNAEAARMRDWASSKGERCVDWNARFRNWIRRALDNPRPPSGARRRGDPPQQEPMTWEPGIRF